MVEFVASCFCDDAQGAIAVVVVAGFKTDVEISANAGVRDAERELEKWEPEGEKLDKPYY